MISGADYLVWYLGQFMTPPGTAETPWIGRLLESAADPVAERAALQARQPHGRLVTADEVAHAVLYLASRRAGSTTGAGLAVDGGMAWPAAAPAHVTVLDAHVHLRDLIARPQPWTAQFPALQRSFLLPELESVLDDHGTDIDHVLACFGTERTMAGSDWPVCLLAAGYATVQATLDPALSQLAAGGRAAVLGGSAAHWYRTSA